MNKFVMMYCNTWTTRPPGECWRVLESFAPARGDMHSPRATVKYTPCTPIRTPVHPYTCTPLYTHICVHLCTHTPI